MTDTATVRVQRVMPAVPEVVFDQWLDPEALEEWMCPRPVRVLDVTVEPHIGGSVRFDVDDSGTRVLITGQFLTIDRPRLLRFTWANSNWPDPTAASVVNVAFEPVGDESGGPGDSHPRAPTERSVTVSRHSALLIAIRRTRTCAPIASVRTARGRV